MLRALHSHYAAKMHQTDIAAVCFLHGNSYAPSGASDLPVIRSSSIHAKLLLFFCQLIHAMLLLFSCQLIHAMLLLFSCQLIHSPLEKFSLYSIVHSATFQKIPTP